VTTKKLTKLLALYLPYILLGLVATNFGEAWRLAEGKELGERIMSIDKSRIQRFLGQTTRNEMRRIEEALMNSLEINEWDRRNADE